MFFSAIAAFCAAQNADFSVPDTICQGKPVIITNVLPVAAASYKWSFCSGNAAYEPDGTNMGNPNQVLNAPRYISLVKDSIFYYTFTTSTGNACVVRCYYGPKLTQTPLITTNLGNFGVLTNKVTGIVVIKDKGTWYGFVANEDKLIRLVFGNSPSNTPTFQVTTLTNVTAASGLAIEQQGAFWVGIGTDMDGSNLFRLDFGQNLGNDPQVVNLGNPAQLNAPASLALAEENSQWYAFVCNTGNSTLSRIEFGASLLNANPAGSVLNSVTGLDLNAGITLINDCGGYNGIVTNCVQVADLCIIHLVFSQGLGGKVIGYNIGNSGILNKPYGISDFVRQGDTLYGYAANYGSSSITRMFFPSCSGASLPFYTGFDPPPVTYPEPGNYNILLTVNDGGSNPSLKCRNIVVVPKPGISLGPDRNLCDGMTTLLDAGAGDSVYAWSTGAVTRTISVDSSGTYWVHAINYWNCDAYDTIKVTVNKTAAATIDTTICRGLSYYAQHALQTTAGVYRDTLRLTTGCDSIVTTNLLVEDCPLLIWFPNAFTPNGDGLNDVFRPGGKDIIRYNMQIFNRWGALIFESGDFNVGWDGYVKGRKSAPDVYTFNSTFESRQFPGVIHREAGTFTLSE